MADPVAQAALDRAFEEDGQLLLVYQPIHDARTGALYGAEALLRQRRRSGEIREATIISETAEENGGPELYTLDNFVVRKAYGEIAHWPPHLRLNVNLSPREFQDGNVQERVTNLVTSCGVDPHRVNLEITETSFIERPEETMHILGDLKALGLSLWLDDFGSGHSALEHLQHFPIDGVKVPREFVKDIADAKPGKAITRAIVALAHELHLQTIAEGVESLEQLEFLRQIGCDYVQGFLFSKPMPPEEFRSVVTSS